MTSDGYSARTKMVVRIAVTAAIAAGVLSACSQGDKNKEAPTSTTGTTTTTTTEAPASSPAITPSEKGGPTKSGNKFTPTVKAPGPQTALPGNIVTAPH